MKRHVLLLLSCTVLVVGCTPPSARSGDFNAADPASKVYAIIEAGQTKDRTSVEALVEQLENDDPLVRVMAIKALQHITGTRLGYNPYAPVADRHPAIKRWIEAIHTQKLGQANNPNP